MRLKKNHVLTDFVTTARFNHEKKLLATKTALTTVENKIPDVSTLATKTRLNSLLPVSTFNNKVTELEGRVTTLYNKFSGFVKKTDYGAEITKIKNDYATNASFDSKLNDLKAQHIATEFKSIDDKTKKNASDILAFESRLKQKEDIIDDVQRDNALTNGRDYYKDKMYFLYECKPYSFKYSGGGTNTWKSTGIDYYSTDSDMGVIANDFANVPTIINNGRMNVKFKGGYYKQNKLIKPNNNNVINVYIVYKLDTASNTRDDTFTVQNTLFGGIKLTKNTDTSKYKYEGYGICFDEGSMFSMGNINNGRNVLIFGVHENSVVHSNNKANNILIMGDGFVQGINDTTLYAEKIYNKNFSAVDEKFVLSLHYNGDNSYLFVNGKQELKFKAKDEQIVKEILCLGNLSDDWTALNATKTGLYGNVYDFAVDYTETSVGNIYNIHRYLM